MEQERVEKITGEDLRRLSRKGYGIWLKDAVLDWMVILTAVTVAASDPDILTFVIATLIVGNRQHALTLLGHDGTHFSLSSNKTINDLVTNIFCFWPICLTVSGYRSLHHIHHRHTGDHSDPELAHKRSRSPQWDLPAPAWKILKWAALDLVGNSIHDYYIIVTYSKPDNLKEYRGAAIWHLAFISAAVLSGFWMAAVIWYISLLTTFMMFFRLRLWLEHQGTSETHRLHLNWWQGALLAPHKGWLHWEHHNWPTVPYYRLQELRSIVGGPKVMGLNELISVFRNSRPILSGQVIEN